MTDRQMLAAFAIAPAGPSGCSATAWPPRSPDRHAAGSGSRVDQVERYVGAGVGE